jgi:hypothetical protein
MAAIRVARDSINVATTADPAVHMVTAAVTTDADTIKTPALRTYTVKWNENTGTDALLALLQAKADADTSVSDIADTIKAAIGEDLTSSTEETESQDYIINATNVTVNQV